MSAPRGVRARARICVCVDVNRNPFATNIFLAINNKCIVIISERDF